MDDLISRQTAINDIETVNPSMPLNVNWVKNWVKTLPSAQPERKKGHWIAIDGNRAICSECGDHWEFWSVMNYCPTCGAIII